MPKSLEEHEIKTESGEDVRQFDGKVSDGMLNLLKKCKLAA